MARTEERHAVADLLEMLQPVCSDGNPAIHLAQRDRDQGIADETLCGLSINDDKPDRTYLKFGCVQCADRAVGAGLFAVRENTASVINLGRFIRLPFVT